MMPGSDDGGAAGSGGERESSVMVHIEDVGAESKMVGKKKRKRKGQNGEREQKYLIKKNMGHVSAGCLTQTHPAFVASTPLSTYV